MHGRQFAIRMNASYFDGGLAQGVIDRISQLPVDREDARALVERMFRSMRNSGFVASDVSLLQADILAALISRLLPGNWEGRVPPITIAGRHSKLDQLAAQTAAEDWLPRTFIDVACGFPPLTTIDTATTLADWQATGVDRSLPIVSSDVWLSPAAAWDAPGGSRTPSTASTSRDMNHTPLARAPSAPQSR